MKNIKNRINDKLFKQEEKVELSEVVELADFADIKTQLDKAEKFYNELLDLSKRIYAVKQEAKKSKAPEMINRIIRELKNDRDKFVSKVKELGIDPNKLSQPKDYEKAIKRISDLEEYAKSKILPEFK